MAQVSHHTALLEAVTAGATPREDVDTGVATDLARVAVRRLTDHELRRADLGRLADDLVDGAALLAARTGPAAVALRDRGEHTVVQLACIDRPFLLSSVLDLLDHDGRHLRFQLHPIVGTTRDDTGTLKELSPARDAVHRETLLHLVVTPPLDDDERTRLDGQLRDLVDAVGAVTDGFERMRNELERHIDLLEAVAGTGSPDDADPAPDVPRRASDPADDPAEVAALLRWLLDEHAVLLGTRRYRLLDADGVAVEDGGGPATQYQADPDHAAGLLADTTTSRYARPTPLTTDPDTLPWSIWSRSRRRSPVQRSARMEHLALPERDADGRTVAVLRVLLLLTRVGEDAPSVGTPVLRRRLAAVLAAEDVVPGSHDDLVLTARFQALPKDELFPLDVAATRQLLLDLLEADEGRTLQVWQREDPLTRTVSVLVAIPRDGYAPQVRERLVEHLRARYDADRVDVRVALDDRGAALLRVLLTLEHDLPAISADEVREELRQLARDWITEVRELVEMRDGPGEADRLVTAYARHLSRSYREAVDPALAATDLRLLDRVAAAGSQLATGWRRDDTVGRWRLRTAVQDAPLELSAYLPILESFGLTVVDEVPHRVATDGPTLYVHDVGVRVDEATDRALGDATARQRVNATIAASWCGHTDVDGLHRLVLRTGMSWREVAVLRAYRRYRRQLGWSLTPAYVEDILVAHAPATAALYGRFRARFDPTIDDRATATARADAAFEEAMADVAQLDADRVLRGLSALVDATLRTTAYRHDAVDVDGIPYVAVKLDPSRLADVPAPVPYREVFVHSPRVEGVHLRAGSVARGGLRWSDRRDDVRTEVLGLVKAQVLKNALIVPTGAKGGFVLTHPPEDPELLRAEVARQYVTYVSALLDLTDDLRAGEDGTLVATPPTDVVRHDGDDPYLVVAADRGTATLSDTANAVATARGFWLGDAFASGGSAGYDHKALGVTARGAWRAVARHLRELGIDDQRDAVTVAGVGDLSGDVFSNGLLRSRSVRLLAAFDHRHVFVDPDPDPDASFDERARVAALGRSSWDDYDRSVLSPGGIIARRDVRSVPVTPQVRELLRLDADEVSPPELVRAVLAANVDVLWAGGIGTYIKAADERHDQVGDRANDEVRVDAGKVRARIIGEGANLFLTQRARIELARRGARVDQDAIHNAAGVATSDAEVNLKILLGLAIEAGELAADERDGVLASLADEVVDRVLDAVDLQVAALSAEAAGAGDHLDDHDAFVRRLEGRGELDRDVEVLPDADEVAARRGVEAGLTRPELATLLAWAKRELKDALLASDVLDDPVLADAAADGFPPTAVARFGHLLPHHRLRRELVATATANLCVDRLGITFASGLATERGISLAEVARAVRVAVDVADGRRWWHELAALEGTAPADRITELRETVARTVRDLTVAVLDEPRLATDAGSIRDRDREVFDALLTHAAELGTEVQRRARLAHARWLVDDLVPVDLALLVANAPLLVLAPEVARITAALPDPRPATNVADVAARLTDVLGLERLEESLRRLAAGEGWARRQHSGTAADLRRLRRELTSAALATADPGATPERVVTGLIARRRASVERALATVREVTAGHADLDAIAVAVRALRDVRP